MSEPSKEDFDDLKFLVYLGWIAATIVIFISYAMHSAAYDQIRALRTRIQILEIKNG